jgi:glycosyltransferase involved in cell wall biosynthesis
MTLRKFIDKYETKDRKVKCYFHCSLQDNIGWDLQWLSAWYQVIDRVIFDRNLQPGIGPTDEQLNEIVNCFDVHVSLTNSEGWHLPALETAAAGVPNLITNYSAHADWGKESLLFCKVGAYEHEPRTGLIKAIADTDHAAHQLNLLYNSKKMCQDYSKRGVKLGQKLDWKNVCAKWIELIDSIDVSAFKEDRYSDPDILPTATNAPTNNDMSLKYFPEE